MTDWQVRTGSLADLDVVGPLWVAVHHRHAETMPQLAPYVSDDETWRVRRELYEQLLAKPDTLLLLAFAGEVAVGYGLAHVLTVDETWIPDTWETDSRIGEIESLSVLPEYRGSGLGSELLGPDACLDRDQLRAHDQPRQFHHRRKRIRRPGNLARFQQ